MFYIVYATGTTLALATQSLKEKVNNLEKDGWISVGAISVVRSGVNGLYMVKQSVVKK